MIFDFENNFIRKAFVKMIVGFVGIRIRRLGDWNFVSSVIFFFMELGGSFFMCFSIMYFIFLGYRSLEMLKICLSFYSF